MKVLLFLLFFLPWVMGQQRGEEEESCYTTEESPYHLLATKTSYFEVDNEDAEPIRVEGEVGGRGSSYPHGTFQR